LNPPRIRMKTAKSGGTEGKRAPPCYQGPLNRPDRYSYADLTRIKSGLSSWPRIAAYMDKNQFLNRRTAGLELARILKPEIRGEAVVLGLSGGGLGTAAVVARYLDAPLYPVFVRTLGIPGHDTLSMGALAAQGVQWLDRDVIGHFSISEEAVQKVMQREALELRRREEVYREMHRHSYDFDRIAGKTAVIVDDGIPNGAHNVLAAIEFVKKYKPQHLLVAVPVISATAWRKLQDKCEKAVCLHRPDIFVSIDYWYGQRDAESPGVSPFDGY
jgi:putative phosphoribosyl transferase